MTPAADGDRSQRFPRRYRVRTRREFVALQRDGRRQSAPHFIVISSGTSGPHVRLGITTSRKVGNAPERNRIRRLVREFFRRHRPRLGAARDLIVIARPGAPTLSYADVVDELSRALRLG
ncbi:ribonuclease P protein component [bacterium]|nr:ribonuclease P protein component [bacterium]